MNDLSLSISEKNMLNSKINIEKGKDTYKLLSEKYNLSYCELTILVWMIYKSKYNYANEARVIVEINNEHKLFSVDKDCDTIEELIHLIKSQNHIVEINETDVILAFEEKNCEYKRKRILFSFYKDDVVININTDESFFDSNIIAEMKSKIQIILVSLINNISSLCEYNVTTKKDMEFYNSINSSIAEYTVEQPLNRLMEIQCEKTPDNIAVYYKDKGYTYLDINEKANYLALKLYDIGVTKGDYIPLLMNRSIELVITLFAIMKVGAVFIPVDINWPKQRVVQVMDATSAKILMVDSEHKMINNKHFHVEYAKLGKASNKDYGVTIEDNIYAIFTSGSTGVPKGAINKHKGIVNRFLYMNKRYKITENDMILLTANHAFDSAVWQLFWPLINGNATVIPDTGANFDIIGIIRLIEKYKITITDFVPSVFNLLVDFICVKKKYISYLKTLRQLLIGGEEMQATYIYKFKQLYPQCSITNTYGPAETSIGTVFYELPDTYIEKIPIGTPIDNVKIYVFDINGKLMPVGATGMLYLGGICVGSGYVNDYEATQNAFMDVRISDDNVEHLYKTGDLVRVNDMGELDFYGRIDNQVKINGVRIEIKEIEKTIMLHGDIDNCCVVVSNRNDKKILYAFYTSKINLSEECVRKFVSHKLPKSMLPHYYIRLDELPINSNGKIDVKALENYKLIV